MHTDERLIRKIIKHKSKTATNALIKRYYDEIYAFAYRQTGEKETAMDITQEIFINVLQKIDSFDERKAGFRTWIYRIASNKITDYYRSSSYKMKTKEQSLYYMPDDDISEQDKTISDKVLNEYQKDLSEVIIQREFIKDIMRIVVTYDREWIEIFQKKCFEEMTFKEIADTMGISLNTVKARFYSMVKRIRREAGDIYE